MKFAKTSILAMASAVAAAAHFPSTGAVVSQFDQRGLEPAEPVCPTGTELVVVKFDNIPDNGKICDGPLVTAGASGFGTGGGQTCGNDQVFGVPEAFTTCDSANPSFNQTVTCEETGTGVRTTNITIPDAVCPSNESKFETIIDRSRNLSFIAIRSSCVSYTCRPSFVLSFSLYDVVVVST